MRLSFSILFILSALLLYVSSSVADGQKEIPEALEKSSHEVISINLDASNDGWADEDPADQLDSTELDTTQSPQYTPMDDVDSQTNTMTEMHASLSAEDASVGYPGLASLESNSVLPGEEVDFRIKLHSSTHHKVQGRADADIGKILFKSRLMPSNEVKLSMKLKQSDLDDIELIAYFDLANFTMELDGANSVLNKEHKQLLNLTSLHLRSRFELQYQDYDIPEHAFMLVQMLDYWSVSPEGFIHEKRSIVSQ